MFFNKNLIENIVIVNINNSIDNICKAHDGLVRIKIPNDFYMYNDLKVMPNEIEEINNNIASIKDIFMEKIESMEEAERRNMSLLPEFYIPNEKEDSSIYGPVKPTDTQRMMARLKARGVDISGMSPDEFFHILLYMSMELTKQHLKMNIIMMQIII